VNKRRIIAVLGMAQFLMVLDSSVMNVSISQLVEDFDTSVTTIQAVITFYALVMAALMLPGGKVGDIIGRRRAFTVGMVIYGIGSALTAVAWNVGVLAFGWSFLEGIGAALVLPALSALIAGNFTGAERAKVFGLMGGIAGAGVAVGPIVGGWVTANLTWRLVFAFEVVIVIVILVLVRSLQDAPVDGERPSMDWVGAALSASGIGLAVYAILQASSWGWLDPRDPPFEIAGFAPTLFVVALGLMLVYACWEWLGYRERRGRTPLVRRALFTIGPVQGGLNMLLVQNLILMGVFFTLPLYLQVVQGLDAFETGLRMLPISVMLLLAATSAPRLADRIGPRRVVRIGVMVMLASIVLIMAQVQPEIDRGPFFVAMALLGAGMGLISSQLSNVVQSSVGDADRSEAGGLVYTANQLGSSIGTALMGAVVIGALSTGFVRLVADNPDIDAAVKEGVATQLTSGVAFVTSEDAREAAEQTSLPPDQIDELIADYEESQLRALQLGLLVAGFIALGAFVVARKLPDRLDEPAPVT
jgi:EmrB/QacA subfamily drug resistance transporter